MMKTNNQLKYRHTIIIVIGMVLICLVAIPSYAEKRLDFRKRGSNELEEISKDDILSEIEFGRILSAKILGKYGLYKDPILTKYINLVGKGLARYSGRPELEFRFAVLDTDSVNAYAAPGGYVFVTLGALKKMRNESDLAGVLAHEIAHITQRHIVKELNIKGVDDSTVSTFTMLIKTIAGGGSLEVAFLELAEKAAHILFEKGLKHEDEFEADKIGTLLVTQVGYYTLALRQYLEVIKKLENNNKLMKVYNMTHPTFEARIKRIVALEKENDLDVLKGQKLEKRFIKFVNQGDT